MHPASRILIYLLAALAIPGLSFFMLAICFSAALALLVLGRRSPLRLVWRTRWLLLVLVLGYAYGLPGEPLFAGLGEYAPSLEGVRHGARQALALTTLLFWLDILVLALPAEHLLGGLHRLLAPLTAVGIDGARVALRLGLTLKAIEGMERGRGNLIPLLEERSAPDLPARITIHDQAVGALDLVVPSALLAAMVGLWLAA